MGAQTLDASDEADESACSVLSQMQAAYKSRAGLMPSELPNELLLRQGGTQSRLCTLTYDDEVLMRKYDVRPAELSRFLESTIDEEDDVLAGMTVIRSQESVDSPEQFAFARNEKHDGVVRALEVFGVEYERGLLVLTDFYQAPQDLMQFAVMAAKRLKANVCIPFLTDIF